MPRDYKLYLEDILEAIEKIQTYIQGITIIDLNNKPMLLDAVLYNLQIIGESAKHLPEDIKSQSPQIEWRKIAGMRDVIAHEYFGVSLEIVWDILQNKLPALKTETQNLLEFND